jgi:fructokinase
MQPQIICLGEGLIDITPGVPGTNIITTGEMLMSASGAPAIVAVALARLGTRAGFIGRVGADFFGHHLKAVLDQNEVDTRYLRLDPSANTGLAFVNWNERGDAVYLFYRERSADTLLEPADIDPAYLSRAQVLQFGSLLLATEPSAQASYYALKIAQEAGLLLSYDLNLRLGGWRDEAVARIGVSGPLQFAHILKINRAELAFLSGETDPEAGSRKIWRENFKLVVVTLDKEGSYFRCARFSGFVPGQAIQAVDTVGAGDAFMAGLLDGLRRGQFDFDDEALIRRACQQGGVAGALAVTRQGAIPALPTRQEVNAFLESPGIPELK